MVDKGKVQKALEICLGDGTCYDCPYKNYEDDCTNALLEDSLILLKKAQPKWVPVSKKNPIRTGKYWVTDYKDVWQGSFITYTKTWTCLASDPGLILAWMPIVKPEPPRKGENDALSRKGD